MKSLSSLVAAALVTVVREAPGASGARLPDWRLGKGRDEGFYQRTLDASTGIATTAFTPLADLARAPAARAPPVVSVEPRMSDVVEGLFRRVAGRADKPCGSVVVSPADVNEAVTCLSDALNVTLALNKNSWAYCIRGGVVAYICPYSDGLKNKTDIVDTWSHIRDRCGPGVVGWTGINHGTGLWNAGYTNSNGTFCTETFKVGDPLPPVKRRERRPAVPWAD